MNNAEIIVELREVISVVSEGVQGPPGPPGEAAAGFVIGEVPIGNINGFNSSFTTEFNFVPESVEVFVNGLKQKRISEFQTIGLNQIILGESPQMGEVILINYIKGE